MRGQQALEYLVTYGWAFVIVLMTIGAFAYFGILNPQQYIPERCEFGQQLQCADFVMLSDETLATPGEVHLRFFNGYGVDIVITDVATPSGGGPVNPGDIVVPAGDISDPVELDLTDSDYQLADGDKTLVPIEVTFRQQAGSRLHTVVGEVFAAAQNQ